MSKITDLSWERHLQTLDDETEEVTLNAPTESDVRQFPQTANGIGLPDVFVITHMEGNVRKFGTFKVAADAREEFVQALKNLAGTEGTLKVQVYLCEEAFPVVAPV